MEKGTEKKTVLQSLKDARLGAVVALSGLGTLSACSVNNQPLPVPPTAEQREACYNEGMKASADVSAALKRDRVHNFTKFVDAATGNAPVQRPNMNTYPTNQGEAARQQCLSDEQLRNTIAAQEVREAAERAAAASAKASAPRNIDESISAFPPAEKPAVETSPVPTATAPTGATSAFTMNDVNIDTLVRTFILESGGGGTLYPPDNGNAKGPMGFMPDTAELFDLKDPHVPYDSFVAGARLQAKNRQELRVDLGREPTESEVDLAHFQGEKGAATLLMNPNANAIDTLSKIVGRGLAVDSVTGKNGGTADTLSRDLVSKRAQAFNEATPNVTHAYGLMSQVFAEHGQTLPEGIMYASTSSSGATLDKLASWSERLVRKTAGLVEGANR